MIGAHQLLVHPRYPKLVQQDRRLFQLPMTKVKINQTIVGGGFSGRAGMIGEPEACAIAWPFEPASRSASAGRRIASERHPGFTG